MIRTACNGPLQCFYGSGRIELYEGIDGTFVQLASFPWRGVMAPVHRITRFR